MEIENSSLWREVQAILDSGEKPVSFYWEAEIHANGQTYVPVRILNIDFNENHEEDFSSEIFITLVIQAGTFYKRVLPFREDIEITLYRSPTNEGGGYLDAARAAVSQRYRATIVDNQDQLLESNVAGTLDEFTLNQTSIPSIRFQLVSKAVEQLRMFSVGGVYRNTTAQKLLQTVITQSFANLQIEKGQVPLGVDMVPASNNEPRVQYVIPQGTMLTDLPDYLQRRCGGVYNAGIGSFLKDDYWFIYPKYDVTRFDAAHRTLTIIRVPPNKLPNVERTYRQQGGTTIILATSNANFRDRSESDQLNQGNGVRYADARLLMDNFVKVDNNKAIVSRGANNSEFVSAQRSTGLNNVRVARAPVSSNPFREYSDLAIRGGSLFSFVWENSNIELIDPGMPVKIYTIDGDDIVELRGVVHGLLHSVQLLGVGGSATRFSTQTGVAVFVNRNY